MSDEYHKREKILHVLKVIRKQHCAYGGGRGCDCKFSGADCKDVGRGSESGNGCCELMVTIGIINQITDEQWNYLLNTSPLPAYINIGTRRIELSSSDVIAMLSERQRLYAQITELQENNNKLLLENRELRSNEEN
ncbi:MAG TPA: hypothetical protein VMX17_07925 [Candidatus Glassbacteria bacterium]|nr:hypothetical protein [Candidatus Glassbacteria bacterium]